MRSRRTSSARASRCSRAEAQRMSTLTRAEASEFRQAVAGVLARRWASPRVAGEPGAGDKLLLAVWEAAAEQEWTTLGGDDALEAALAAVAELGRVACPLPLLDAYVAA